MKLNTTKFNTVGPFTKLIIFLGVFLVFSETQIMGQNKVFANSQTNTGAVDNPENALLDDNSYASLFAYGGDIIFGGAYEGEIELEFPSSVPANTWAYVSMDTDTGLLDGLLGGSLGGLLTGLLDNLILGNQEIVIKASIGNFSVLTSSSSSGFDSENVRVIQDVDGNDYLAIRSQFGFNKLTITHKKSALLDLGGEKELRVYNAFYFEENTGGECGRPFATSFDGGGGIGLSLLEVSEQNLNNAIDSDITTYSSLKSNSVLNLNVASSLQQNFYFSTSSSVNNTLNITLALGSSGLLNADLLGSIQVLLYDDNDNLIYTRTLQSGLLNNTDLLALLDSGDTITVTFAPGIVFNKAAVQLNTGLGLDLLGDGVKIYDVQRYDDNFGCLNPEIDADAVATTGPLEVSSCASVLSDFENVDFPFNAVDGNNETYAILNADAGNLLTSGASSGFVQMDLGSVPQGQTTYVRIDYDDDVLDRLLGGSLGQLVSDLGNGLLLGDQYIQVQAIDALGATVLDLDSRDFFGGVNGDATGNVTVVEDNIGRYYLAIKPNAAYGYKSIRITNHVTAVLPTGKQSSLHVYNACFETGTDLCFPANFTSYTGSGISLSLAELSTAGVTDPYKVINDNSSDYSEINLGVAGVAASVYQSVYYTSPSQAGDHVKVRFSLEPSALLSLDVLGTYKIKFYNDTDQVGPDYTIQNGLVNNVDLLGLFNSGGTVTLDFMPTGTFNRVDVGIESVVALSTTSPPMRLYEVTRYGDACPIVLTPSPFVDSLCLGEVVDSQNTDELQNLFDDDFDSYATISSGAGFLLGSNKYEGFVEMSYDQELAAGVTSYIRIDFDTTILDGLVSGSLGNVVAGLLDGLLLGDHYFTVDVKNNTYDATTGAVTASTTITSASSNSASVGGNNMIRVVQDTQGRYYIAVTPNAAYNAVRITDVTNSALGLLAQPNTMNVYGMCTELSDSKCANAFATSYEYTGLDLSVTDLSGAGVTNMVRAIDDNTTNFSVISNGTLAVASSTKQWIFFNTVSNNTNSVIVKFKIGGSGVNLSVLGDLQISAYLGNTHVQDFVMPGGGIINGVDVVALLNSGGTAELEFTPGANFDRISVGINTLVGASLLPPIHLYGVSRECDDIAFPMITNPMIYQKIDQTN